MSAQVTVERPALLHHIQSCRRTGSRLAVYEWPAMETDFQEAEQTSQIPTVVFLHATGHHARCWDKVVNSLPASIRCFCVDQLGHGLSDAPDPSGLDTEDSSVEALAYSWPRMGRGLCAVLRTLGVRGALAVGHSGGGYLATFAASEERSLFGALLLLDPVIFTRESYKSSLDPALRAMFSGIGRRRSFFPGGARELWDSLHTRPPFNTWDKRILRDYCYYGLLPAPSTAGDSSSKKASKPPSGLIDTTNSTIKEQIYVPRKPSKNHQFTSDTMIRQPDGSDAPKTRSEMPGVLACSPAVEMACYQSGQLSPLGERIATIKIPVTIIRAKQATSPEAVDFSSSPTDPKLHEKMGGPTRDIALKSSHFFPQEDPLLVVQYVMDMLASMSFPGFYSAGTPPVHLQPKF